MYRTEFAKNRTQREKLLEIETVKEFFEFDKYPIKAGRMKFLEDESKRDRVIINLNYNIIESGFVLYSHKLDWFKEPRREWYEVLLKGDLFLVHNKTTKTLRIYNRLNWTRLEEGTLTGINLRSDFKELTQELIKKKIDL